MEAVFAFMTKTILDLEKDLVETRANLEIAKTKNHRLLQEAKLAKSRIQQLEEEAQLEEAQLEEEDANEYLESDNEDDYPEPSFSPSYM
jgi:hypothetical protein